MGMESIRIFSNPGSSSKKYSVYSEDTEIAWLHFEKQNTDFVCSYKVVNTFQKVYVDEDVYTEALLFVINLLEKESIIQDKKEIKSISIRTVIPDSNFVKDIVLTKRIIKKLTNIQSYDPLHITPVVDELQTIEKFVYAKTKICLISDSTFHETSKRLLPVKFENDMYSIGYHGLSCESVLSILDSQNIKHSKLVVCHLGGGSSVSTILNGKSVYNSMDYSPLGGTFMASRSGSVDPFLILSLMKEKDVTYQDALLHLYKDSGLKALSKTSDDLRVVREEAFKGNADAKQAIIQFVDSITSYILKAASYSNGIDTLVFTGTIGFRASYIREMVAEKLRWIGVIMNHDKNLEDMNTCFEISRYDSKIKIYVVLIDEMREMHKHTTQLLKK